MLRRIGRELVGIIGALVTWWALAVLIGLLMYASFPPRIHRSQLGLHWNPRISRGIWLDSSPRFLLFVR